LEGVAREDDRGTAGELAEGPLIGSALVLLMTVDRGPPNAVALVILPKVIA